MKISFIRKSDGRVYGADEIVPSATATEHLQRVEEWTQKSQSSNKQKSAKQFENEDQEAKSQLIIEAVQLMDTRELQMRAKPKPPVQPETIFEEITENALEELADNSSVVGYRFRASGQSARSYVGQFESKINEKKQIEKAIFDSYNIPKDEFSSRKGKKMATKPEGMDSSMLTRSNMDEPAGWRYRMSRNVNFKITDSGVSPSDVLKESAINEDDKKWTTKQENDRDFWKWRLRQRFLQNDALLQKLALQREKIESSFPGNINKLRQAAALSTYKPVSVSATAKPSKMPPFFPPNRHSSRHVTVELPAVAFGDPNDNIGRGLETKTREPMPNFYKPSRKVITILKAEASVDPITKDDASTNQAKLQKLKKDPYLAKLLAGNDNFKPETMLELSPSRKREPVPSNQTADETKSTIAKKKLSIESLSDTEDSVNILFNSQLRGLR